MLFVGGTWLSHFAVMAYDASRGDLIWARLMDFRLGPPERPAALAQSPDGARWFIAGSAGPSGVLFSLDAVDGEVLWSEVLEELPEPHALAASPDGLSVYLAGGAARCRAGIVTTAPGRSSTECATSRLRSTGPSMSPESGVPSRRWPTTDTPT